VISKKHNIVGHVFETEDKFLKINAGLFQGYICGCLLALLKEIN
jgi:hypothetical protein